MKYPKDKLMLVVAKSHSVVEVLKHLGITSKSGNMHAYITSLIRKYEIDCSHFKNRSHHIPTSKRHFSEILILRSDGTRQRSHVLRRALLDAGIEERCKCGLGPIWNDKPLRLHVDHEDGNSSDDRIDNLRFLCPNCHSQTETYAKTKTSLAKNRVCSCGNKLNQRNKSGLCFICVPKYGTEILWPAKTNGSIKTCVTCGNVVSRKSVSGLCRSCAHKPIAPSINKDILNDLIWKMPATKIAERYGVSDKTISKWCTKFGLQKPGPGYWTKARELGRQV